MPLTSLLWVAVFVLCLAASLVTPLFGLAAYLLEYYQRPNLHWWGAWLPDLRWNFTAALVFAVTYILRAVASDRPSAPRHVALGLLIALGINILMVNFWAVDPAESWLLTSHFWKLIAIYFLIAGVLRTRLALDLFLLLNIVGVAWWGVDALDAQRIKSRLEGVGAYDTLNSNLLAAHILTIVPMLVLYLLAERDKRVKLVALVSLPFVFNLFILANSRGATLGLIAAGLGALALVRFKQRKRTVLGVIIAGMAFYALADPQFVQRQNTTTSMQEGDAQTRFALWSGTLRMISDYPFGAGGRGFHILSLQYAPEAISEDALIGRSSHNSYLQLTAEWGIIGGLLWLAFLGTTFWSLHGIRRRSTTADWFYYRSLGLELGLIGTLVAAFFSVRYYGESVYWMAAAAYGLRAIEFTARNEGVVRETAAQGAFASGPVAPRPVTATSRTQAPARGSRPVRSRIRNHQPPANAR